MNIIYKQSDREPGYNVDPEELREYARAAKYIAIMRSSDYLEDHEGDILQPTHTSTIVDSQRIYEGRLFAGQVCGVRTYSGFTHDRHFVQSVDPDLSGKMDIFGQLVFTNQYRTYHIDKGRAKKIQKRMTYPEIGSELAEYGFTVDRVQRKTQLPSDKPWYLMDRVVNIFGHVEDVPVLGQINLGPTDMWVTQLAKMEHYLLAKNHPEEYGFLFQNSVSLASGRVFAKTGRDNSVNITFGTYREEHYHEPEQINVRYMKQRFVDFLMRKKRRFVAEPFSEEQFDTVFPSLLPSLRFLMSRVALGVEITNKLPSGMEISIPPAIVHNRHQIATMSQAFYLEADELPPQLEWTEHLHKG